MSNVPVIGLIVTKMLTAVWQILVPFFLGVLAVRAGAWPKRDRAMLSICLYAYIILAVAGILGVF